MKKRAASICFSFLALAVSAYGQATITVYDPTRIKPEEKISPAVQAAVETASASASKSISEDTCKREVEIMGTATGSFTRAGAKQTLAFYQYCQTGNGFGWAGLVLIEGGKVTGNYIAEAGWTVAIERVADVNGNGLDEFALAYSGGMHQGQGGTGVDLLEFTNGSPKGFGWYKAEEFGPTEASNVWKLTAKPGPTPLYYTQKFFSGENSKYRPVGKTVAAKLGKPFSKFTAVK
jgi:hypothetical protein